MRCDVRGYPTPTITWFKNGEQVKADGRKVCCFLYLLHVVQFCLWLVPETKIAEFANSVDLGEVAHNEPPHLDLHCLHSSL